MMKKYMGNKFKINLKQIKIYFLFSLIGILSLLFFGKYAILIIYGLIGIKLGHISTLYGKMIPHIAPETMTTMSIFAGMMFSASTGFFYGFIVSMIVYIMCAIVKHTTIINSFIIGLGGLYAGLLMTLFPTNLTLVYIFALILRTLSGAGIFFFVNGGLDIEAVVHAIFDPLWNILVYLPTLGAIILMFI